MRENLITKMTFDFSLKIINLYKDLTKNHEYVISKQLLRSSTSIGANVAEAIAAFSKKEFAYKMSIATREAHETYYWLRLLKESKLVNYDLADHDKDIKSIIKILTSIVKTTTENLKKNNQ